MAADMGQAAADEDEVAQAVDAPQFADGIEDDAVVFGPDRFPGLHIATLDHSDAVLDAFVDDEIGLIDIARGDDQFGFREMVPYLDEGLVDRAVLPFVGTAGDHDGIRPFGKAQFVEEALLFGFRDDAIGLVVLGVARDDDLVGIGADVDDIRPFGYHFFHVLQGYIGIIPFPAIRKRVRRIIEDAHDQRPFPDSQGFSIFPMIMTNFHNNSSQQKKR